MFHPPSKRRRSEREGLEPVDRAVLPYLSQARAAMRNGDYQTAIDLLSSRIKSSPKDFEAFNWRAAAYKRVGNYEAALTDAKTLQKCNPRSAIGYIWMVEIHLARRQFGSASEALVLALANVHQRSRLYWRLRELAIIVSQRRFDFLETVPGEVLATILSKLSIQDRISLMDVSIAWRKHMTNWIDFCSDVETRPIASLNEEYVVQYLERGGRGIRRCFLFHNAQEVIEKQYYIVKNRCCYIEQLTIENFIVQNFDNLSRTLAFLAKSLTKLALEYCTVPLSYILEVVLDTCINLTRLQWTTDCNNGQTYNLSSRSKIGKRMSTSPTKLEYLCLGTIVREYGDKIHPLELLLRRCPKLRYLELHMVTEYNEPHIELEIIRQHCPLIHYLHYHDDTFLCHLLEEGTYPASIPGMVELCISHCVGNVVKFLGTAQSTLRSLSITPSELSTALLDLLSTMEVLEYLHIQGRAEIKNIFPAEPLRDTLPMELKKCFSRCSNLRTLSLGDLDFVTDDILKGLQYCEKFSDISISSCRNVSERGILDLVNILPTLMTVRIVLYDTYDELIIKEISSKMESRGGYFSYVLIPQ